MDVRMEGVPMITYFELVQIGIFIVALVSLCYQIFGGKNPATTRNSDGGPLRPYLLFIENA